MSRRDLAQAHPSSDPPACCTCMNHIQSPREAHACPCLTRSFYTQSSETSKRLRTEAHFVRFNNALHSLKIPSLALDEESHTLSFDWRQFFHELYLKELLSRRLTHSWIQHATLLSDPQRLLVHGQCGLAGAFYTVSQICERWETDGWIFWTKSKDQENLLEMDMQSARASDKLFQVPIQSLRGPPPSTLR
jgi:hypothetical protein